MRAWDGRGSAARTARSIGRTSAYTPPTALPQEGNHASSQRQRSRSRLQARQAERGRSHPPGWRRGSYRTIRQGDWKLLFRKGHPVRLYNLKDDIAEEKDLATASPEKMKELSALLDKWEEEMSKTAEPFRAAEKRKKR